MHTQTRIFYPLPLLCRAHFVFPLYMYKLQVSLPSPLKINLTKVSYKTFTYHRMLFILAKLQNRGLQLFTYIRYQWPGYGAP